MKVSKAKARPVETSTITEGAYVNGIKVPVGFLAVEKAKTRQMVLLNSSININNVFEGERFELAEWMIDEVRMETTIKATIYRVKGQK